MKYIALLRGINVGGNHKVEMKKLKALFESAGFDNVSTYINSGNVIFESKGRRDMIYKKVEAILKKEFAFDIPLLIKTSKEMNTIYKAIPKDWRNNDRYKTDVAYLFPDVDSKIILRELPINREVVYVRCAKGAIFWNVKRSEYNKSNLNKIISHKIYKTMTVRNINTSQYLAGDYS